MEPTIRQRLPLPQLLLLAGIFLLVLAQRWWLVEGYNSPLPFWDDWLDTVNLLRSIHAGATDWGRFVHIHNGHALTTERLLTALLFVVNQHQWDGQVQSTVNALFAAAIPLVLLLGVGERGKNVPLAACAAVIWLAPVLWYNSTWGIQVQVTFVLLFGLLGILGLTGRAPWSPGWWLGVVSALLCVYSLGSGLLVPLAVIGAALCAVWQGRKIRELWAGVAVALALIAVWWFFQHIPDYPRPFKARNLADFALAMARNLSWPWCQDYIQAETEFYGLALSLPAPILTAAWLLRAKWLRLPEHLAAVWPGLFFFTLGMLAAVSLERGVDGRPGSWRHFDYHAVWVFLNAVALAHLLRSLAETLPGLAEGVRARARAALLLAPVVFAAVLAGGLVRQSLLAGEALQDRQHSNALQEATIRAYLATGDRAALKATPHLHTPFIYLEDPGALLDDPVIRDLLPYNVRPPLPLRPVEGAFPAARAFIRAPMPPFLPTPAWDNLWLSWRPDLPPKGPGGMGKWSVDAGRFPYLWTRVYGDTGPTGRPPLVASGRTGALDPGEAGQGLRNGVWNELFLGAWGARTELVVVEPSPTSWLAVQEPRPAGRLTVWCHRLRSGLPALAALGAALVVGAFLTWRREEAA
jgi:hypothetical protein